MIFSVTELAAYPGNKWRLRLCDKQTVARYTRMRTPTGPIVVNTDGFILDGLHRVAAAIAKGRAEIEGVRK
jgi:hypothetical protein